MLNLQGKIGNDPLIFGHEHQCYIIYHVNQSHLNMRWDDNYLLSISKLEFSPLSLFVTMIEVP